MNTPSEKLAVILERLAAPTHPDDLAPLLRAFAEQLERECTCTQLLEKGAVGEPAQRCYLLSRKER